MTQNSRTGDLTSGPMLQKIILFSLPLAASSILQLLFNAADVVVVGRFAGSTALAAVGSNGALINLLVNLFVGLSLGANVVAARCFGAKDEEGVHTTVQTSVTLGLVSGLFLAVVGIFAARGLLELMSCPEDVIDLSTLYLKIYFIGMPMTMLYNFSSALLRAVGDTKRPLFCLAVAGAINVVLNLVFVILFSMSVAGVALATIISQTVSACMVTALLVKEKGPLHLDLGHLGFHAGALGQILRIGLPAGLQSTVFSLSNVVIQSAVNSFGSTIVAGNSAASNLEGFVYTAMNAFAQAAVTFTSQNMGARRYDNLDRVMRNCLLCAPSPASCWAVVPPCWASSCSTSTPPTRPWSRPDWPVCTSSAPPTCSAAAWTCWPAVCAAGATPSCRWWSASWAAACSVWSGSPPSSSCSARPPPSISATPSAGS